MLRFAPRTGTAFVHFLVLLRRNEPKTVQVNMVSLAELTRGSVACLSPSPLCQVGDICVSELV